MSSTLFPSQSVIALAELGILTNLAFLAVVLLRAWIRSVKGVALMVRWQAFKDTLRWTAVVIGCMVAGYLLCLATIGGAW